MFRKIAPGPIKSASTEVFRKIEMLSHSTTNPATFGFLHFLEQFYTILSFFGAGYMENDSKYKYFFGKEPAGYFISETESCQFHVAFQRFGVKAGRGPLFIICMDIYMRC